MGSCVWILVLHIKIICRELLGMVMMEKVCNKTKIRGFISILPLWFLQALRYKILAIPIAMFSVTTNIKFQKLKTQLNGLILSSDSSLQIPVGIDNTVRVL